MAALVRKLLAKSSRNRRQKFDAAIRLDKSGRTFVVCVLLIDIVGFSKRSVSSQRAVKGRFNAMLTNTLASVPRQSRIEVDTGDGVATAFFGDPEDALFAALAFLDQMRTIGGDWFVRIGINLGPIRVIHGVGGNRKLVGDGMNDVEAVMTSAAPGQVIVSHSYFEMLARICDSHPQLFARVEMTKEKHRKKRQFYRFVGEEIDAKRIMREILGRSRSHLPSSSPHTFRRVLDHGASSLQGFFSKGVNISASVAMLLLVSLAAWWTLSGNTNSWPSGASGAPTAQSTKGVAKSVTAIDAESGAPETIVMTKGVILLLVQPWGEIYIDGVRRGISPPLKSLKLAQGKYRIEVRNGEFAPYRDTIEVKNGQTHKVIHTF